MLKEVIIDVEATGDGTDINHHIIELAAEIWIKDTKVDTLYLKAAPNVQTKFMKLKSGKGAHKSRALKYAEMGLESEKELYHKFNAWLSQYINPYRPEDKAMAIAHNARYDEKHIINLFKRNKDPYLASYFYPPFICTQAMTLLVLGDDISILKDRKLATLCKYLNIPIESNRLHQADYDAHITALLYQKLKGRLNDKVVPLEKNSGLRVVR